MNQNKERENNELAAIWILRQMHGIYPEGSSERWALEIAIEILEKGDKSYVNQNEGIEE